MNEHDSHESTRIGKTFFDRAANKLGQMIPCFQHPVPGQIISHER